MNTLFFIQSFASTCDRFMWYKGGPVPKFRIFYPAGLIYWVYVILAKISSQNHVTSKTQKTFFFIFFSSGIKRFIIFQKIFVLCSEPHLKMGQKQVFGHFWPPFFKVIGCQYKHEILGIIFQYSSLLISIEKTHLKIDFRCLFSNL